MANLEQCRSPPIAVTGTLQAREPLPVDKQRDERRIPGLRRIKPDSQRGAEHSRAQPKANDTFKVFNPPSLQTVADGKIMLLFVFLTGLTQSNSLSRTKLDYLKKFLLKELTAAPEVF